jgi:hypothetical protein
LAARRGGVRRGAAVRRLGPRGAAPACAGGAGGQEEGVVRVAGVGLVQEWVFAVERARRPLGARQRRRRAKKMAAAALSRGAATVFDVLKMKDDVHETAPLASRPRGPAGHRAWVARAWPAWRAARGRPAGPSACLGAAHGRQRGGGPTARGPPRQTRGSVRRSPARAARGRGTGAALWSARRRRSAPFLFHLPVFEIAKLQKSSTKLKISQKQSCRGAIDL